MKFALDLFKQRFGLFGIDLEKSIRTNLKLQIRKSLFQITPSDNAKGFRTQNHISLFSIDIETHTHKTKALHPLTTLLPQIMHFAIFSDDRQQQFPRPPPDPE